MGYTHYYYVGFSEADMIGYNQALPVLRDIAWRHRKLLCRECDMPKTLPEIGSDGIFLNGKGKMGYETFWFQLPEAAPGRSLAEPAPVPMQCCKTEHRLYDLPVTEMLLVLRAYMTQNLKIDSDGFATHLGAAERDPLAALDGVWAQAIKNVKKHYGIDTAVSIAERRDPYCDLLVVPTLTA